METGHRALLFVSNNLQAYSYVSPCIYNISDPYTEWWVIRSHCCKYARAAHCRGHINTTERGVSRAHLWFFTFFLFLLSRQMRQIGKRKREKRVIRLFPEDLSRTRSLGRFAPILSLFQDWQICT